MCKGSTPGPEPMPEPQGLCLARHGRGHGLSVGHAPALSLSLRPAAGGGHAPPPPGVASLAKGAPPRPRGRRSGMGAGSDGTRRLHAGLWRQQWRLDKGGTSGNLPSMATIRFEIEQEVWSRASIAAFQSGKRLNEWVRELITRAAMEGTVSVPVARAEPARVPAPQLQPEPESKPVPEPVVQSAAQGPKQEAEVVQGAPQTGAQVDKWAPQPADFRAKVREPYTRAIQQGKKP